MVIFCLGSLQFVALMLAHSQEHSRIDLEGLEADNDRSIAALSERVGALRGITSGIHGEVESQHRLLDSMVRIRCATFH